MIYLIRHGQTDANRNRYAGREDVALNETGRDQASALAARLRHRSLVRIFCSPLSRAIETATPLAIEHRLDVQLRPHLLELDFGVLQGRNKMDHRLSLRHKHLYDPVSGGESLLDVWQRIEAVSLEIRSVVDEQGSVAIVAHYWTNRLLFGQLTGLTLEATAAAGSYKPETGSCREIVTNEIDRAVRFGV